MRRSAPRLARYAFQGHVPRVAKSAFVAPSADLIGQVKIHEKASVWYQCVLRGDLNYIEIGAGSNIQDGTVIHVRSGALNGGNHSNGAHPCVIEDNVTVGHMALLHACTLKSHSFVGMHSTVMDFAVVEERAMVGAGSLVLGKQVIPSGELWAGRPAKFVRVLKKGELEFLAKSAEGYQEFARQHREECELVEEGEEGEAGGGGDKREHV